MAQRKTEKRKATSQVRKAVDGYKGIYFNETTKKYDVKNNFKVYDPQTGKNTYKQKWSYNHRTLEDAKNALAMLRNNGVKPVDKEITLDGIHQIWIVYVQSEGMSEKTIKNTENQLKIIYEFLPKDTKLKNITEDVYDKLFVMLRAKELSNGNHYSEETLHSLNACLHKLLKLAWRRGLITENPLDRATRKKFRVKKEIKKGGEKIVTKEEFQAITDYFEQNKFVRNGVDRYKGYNALVRFLYFTGCRIGEALAVTYADLLRVKTDKDGKETITVFDYPDNEADGEVDIVEVNIDKVRLASGATETYAHRAEIRHETKNKKDRTIPLNLVECMFYIEYWWEECGRPDYSTRIFDWTDSNARAMIQKACEETGIRKHTCHDFRHTFISNLMADPNVSLADVEALSGDTQETILARYSHMLPEAKKKFELATDKW